MQIESKNTKKILIVGGGFGGIRTALDLSKKNIKDTRIILLSNKTHFEYYPALYRVVTGKSPLEVCIPLDDIFDDTNVEVVYDEALTFDLTLKKVNGKSGAEYHYDFLVIGLGSETAYFNIPGLKEFSFGFKSINEALKLKNHIHSIFQDHSIMNPEKDSMNKKIVIIGGGSAGVELASELAIYMKRVLEMHGVNQKDFEIILIEGAPRLLPMMPESFSYSAKERLESLGVHVYVGQAVMKQEQNKVYLSDMIFSSSTIIWTAGVKTHHLYSEITGLSFHEKGKVLVDEYMQAKGHQNVFIIGDGAYTPFSGLAQTAIYDGKYVAYVIKQKISARRINPYIPKKVSYAIPVGKPFALVLTGGLSFFGWIAWRIRRLVDLRYFMSILPFDKAMVAYTDGAKLCELCTTCNTEEV
jgi:NADH dehydrogenase